MALSDPKLSTVQEGLVIAHLGKGLAVEIDSGETILCHSRRKLGIATVGDRVLWEPAEGNLGCVLKILERRTILNRPARQQKTRPVAANLDQILIVFAVEPRCDFLLLDQYLVICENSGIKALLIYNKIDLATQSPNLEKELSIYKNLGYETLRVSAMSGVGLENLKSHLSEHTSMLAGQSGVGKSSLTNALIPDKNLPTGELSQGNLHGKHTTTTTTLFHLPGGGDLIDSPGVAIFGLAETSESDLAFGYREFQQFRGQCRFNDCRHLNDKDCAIRLAVKNGIIDEGRYRRFLKLREKLPKF